MTITKDSVLTKATVAFVAFTAGLFMLGGAAIAPAYGQSNDDLQAQIQSLLETIASLQAQIDGDSSAGVSNCPSSIFSLSAGQGAQGQAVQDLQIFLNMDADTRVAATGPGSPGNETMFYGALTAQAVSNFQSKYSANVLAPLGLSGATGYWGSSSASQAQALCAQQAADDADDADDSDDSDDSDDDSSSDDLSGGEASLEDYDISSGADSDVEEGDTAEIAEVEFDVEDGDVNVSRIDVAFQADSGNNAAADDEPWDVFEEVSIIVDGDEIASKNVDDEDDWLDDDADSNGFYEVRFSGLDFVVREGDTAEFTIAVEVASNVDDAANSPTWDVAILEDGIRAIDGEGINQYIGNDDDTSADTQSFDIDEEGGDEELNVTSSSDDPDESVIQVDEDDRSDEYGIFAFDMEAEGNDLEVNEIKVDIDLRGLTNASSTDYDDIVNDGYLEIDGQQFDIDSKSVGAAGGTTATATLTFDIDGDLTIDEDDEVTAMLFLEFNQQNGNYVGGEEIRAKVNADDFDVEGADDLSASQLDGTATGDYHTLLVEGVYAADAADTSASQSEGLASYEFVVELTAFETDVYLSATSTANESDAFEIGTIGTGTTTYSFVSDADQETNNSYKIDEGSTEEFTITVTFDPLNSGSYRATLSSVNFETTNDSDPTDDSYDFTPTSDFRTAAITVPGTGDASEN
ncbi:MAG: hypothetical protein WD335_03935 [Candidatus Paceibacterota bacterium]